MGGEAPCTPVPAIVSAAVRNCNVSENNNNSFLEDEVNRLLGTTTENLQKLAEKFMLRYKELTNDDDKRRALAKYFVDINQWRN